MKNQGHTTEFIRRRTLHWKTTVAGIGSIVCPILGILFPHIFESSKVLLLSSLFSGWGFISAADGSNVNQPSK